MKKEHYYRGFKRNEFVEFFLECGGKLALDGRIIGDGFEADISDEYSVSLGSLPVTEVKVVVQGEIHDIEKKLFLKFLRGGA